MPRNPKSYGSKQDKKAALVPLRVALGEAKATLKAATQASKTSLGVASKAAKSALMLAKRHDKHVKKAEDTVHKLELRIGALEAIPVVPVAAKPAKVPSARRPRRTAAPAPQPEAPAT